MLKTTTDEFLIELVSTGKGSTTHLAYNKNDTIINGLFTNKERAIKRVSSDSNKIN